MPTTMKILSCPVPEDIEQALRVLKDRDGMPVSEAVRRALRAYLEERGVLKPSPKPRTQRRPR